MKNKKLLFLLCLLIVFLLSFSIVSANDNTTTKSNIKDKVKPVTNKDIVKSKEVKDLKTQENNIKSHSKSNDKKILNDEKYSSQVKKSSYYYDEEEKEIANYSDLVDIYLYDNDDNDNHDYIEEAGNNDEDFREGYDEDYNDNEFNNYTSQTGKTTDNVQTTKKVNLNILTSQNPKTDGKLKITIKALNGTTKLNVGKIKVKFNSKQIAYKGVYNGKITLNYKLPIKSGTYKITAEYDKNNKKLATKNKNIKIKDSEKITFKTNTNSKTDTKHTFTVRVTNANGKVNYGTVRIKLNGKTLTNKKVKNGISKIIYRMPNKAGNYKATAEYIKYDKVIQSISKNINLKNSEKITLNTKTSTIGYTDHLFEVKVTKPNGKVDTGTVRIKLNGKVIANENVKNGIIKTTYKLPNKTGIFKVTAEYIKYGKVVKSVSKNINVKYNQYPILTKTITFKDDIYYEKLGAGDYAYPFIEWQDAQYDEGAYVSLWYDGINGGDMYPHTYRLTKATFYHENYYTGKIIKDTVEPDCYYITDKYTLVKSRLRYNYEPIKVQIYYRKMTPNEKKILMKYA